MAKLSAIQVRKAKPGRHADGKGLYLLVKAKRNAKTGLSNPARSRECFGFRWLVAAAISASAHSIS